MKLRKATFKHIEAELYAYKDTLKEIEKLRQEIMYGYREQDESGIRSSAIGRPTEQIATRLVTDKRLRNLEEIVYAIESVLGMLDETQRKLVNLKYLNKNNSLNWLGIAEECNIHEQTAYKYRRMIIYAIAEKVGWR
ncbi:MAG: transcriptional regulator [Bacillota bacterium]